MDNSDLQKSEIESYDQEMNEALALVDAIEQALVDQDEDDKILDENSFEFPLSLALGLLPEHYLKDVDVSETEGESVIIGVDDLFDQLAGGKVVMPVSRLVYFIPLHLVYRAACDDNEAIQLPLREVVRSVGTYRFTQHTPLIPKDFNIGGMEDPFKPAEPVEEAVDTVILEDDDEDDEPVHLEEVTFVEEVAAANDEEPPAQEQAEPVSEQTVAPPVPEAPAPPVEEAIPSSVEEPQDESTPQPEPAPAPTEEQKPEPVPPAETAPGPVEDIETPEVQEPVPAEQEPAPAPSAEQEPAPVPAGPPPDAVPPAETTLEPVEDVETPGVQEPLPAKQESVSVDWCASGFDYPASDILERIPSELVVEGASCEETVKVRVPDLFEQLRAGRVHVLLKELAGLLPDGIVGEDAVNDSETMIALDVRRIVELIGAGEFVKRTPTDTTSYDIERMIDPFEEPAELPRLERRQKPAAAKPPSEEERKIGAVVTEAPQGVPSEARVMTYTPSEGDPADLEYRELPGNVNVNMANADELSILDGVTPEIASAILAYREEHKGFDTIFDLMKVQGVGPTQFRKMTGMKAERKRYHRRNRLAGLLKISPSDVTDLNSVAAALSRKSGFLGCLIADRDGLVLAENGIKRVAEGLSAIVPRMFRQISHNMELIGGGEIRTVTVAMDEMLCTFATTGNVTLIAVHDMNRMSQTELAFVRKVARELAWLLSLRAYVGPKV